MSSYKEINITPKGLIGEGGFGCIFRPPIDCKGNIAKEERTYISKIVKKGPEVENEVEIGILVREIKLHTSFFVTVSRDCSSINVSQLKIDETDKCEAFKRFPNDEFSILKMQYIKGEPLGKYLASQDINDSQRFQSNFQGYMHLLSALELLTGKNIVHFDIKSGNILFSLKLTRPVIIDFGLSFLMDDKYKKINDKSMPFLHKYFYIYAPDYYIWSPEIHLLNYLLHVNRYPNIDQLRDIAKNIVKNNPVLKNNFTEKFAERYENALLLNFKNLMDSESSTISGHYKIVEKLLQTWKTWDNFALSIFYLKQLIFQFGDNPIIDNKYLSFLIQLLTTNISPFAETRLTPHLTKIKLRKWLETDPNALNSLINYKSLMKSNPLHYDLALKDEIAMKELTNRLTNKRARRDRV